MSLLHIVLVSLLAASHPAPPPPPAVVANDAGQAPEMAPSQRVYLARLRETLRSSPSARDRALGSQFFGVGPFDEKEQLLRGRELRAAAQAAPTDRLVQYLWTMNAGPMSGCDERAPCPERRLAATRAEPDNGMAWLSAANLGKEERASPKVDVLLARAADSERFDTHFVDLVRSWSQVYKANPLPPEAIANALGASQWTNVDEAGMVMAIAQSAVFASSGSPRLMCRRHDLPQLPEARFALCARLGRKIMHLANSTIEQKLGYSLIKTAGVTPTAEDEAFYRRLQWRERAASGYFEPSQNPGEFRAYFADLLSTNDEGRAQELVLARHGIPLEPPKGWKPEGM